MKQRYLKLNLVVWSEYLNVIYLIRKLVETLWKKRGLGIMIKSIDNCFGGFYEIKSIKSIDVIKDVSYNNLVATLELL